MSHPHSRSSSRKTTAIDKHSDIVPPATEQERALFGEFRPAYLYPSRTEEMHRVASTIDRVAAGGEEFVTADQVMKDLDSTFDGNFGATTLKIPKVGRVSGRILSALCARMQSISVEKRAEMEKPYLDNLRLSLQLYRKADESRTGNAESNFSTSVLNSTRSEARSTQLSQTSFGMTSDNSFSTQSSLLSCTLPTVISSWSSSLESILSRSSQSSGSGDFPDNFMQTGSPPAQQALPVTPPPSKKRQGRASNAADVRKELDVNAAVHRPPVGKGKNCSSGRKKKSTANEEEHQIMEPTHVLSHVLPRRTPVENENLVRITRKSSEASSILPKRTPLPFQDKNVTRKTTKPAATVHNPHMSLKPTAGSIQKSASRDVDKETQHRKRKRAPPMDTSSCEESIKRRLRPMLPRMAKK
ncbi:hypothetical protein Y032_0128g1431 [Ancylostoma ceylanicum]|nr:hypothetical protein Y032_0128g1431 [Ancylostoma ceylanicum]